jgi:hypothetical protein
MLTRQHGGVFVFCIWGHFPCPLAHGFEGQDLLKTVGTFRDDGMSHKESEFSGLSK